MQCPSVKKLKSFQIKGQVHRHSTRGNSLNVPPVKTTTYDSNSVTICAMRLKQSSKFSRG